MKVLFICEEDVYADGIEIICKEIIPEVEITRKYVGDDLEEVLAENKYDAAFIAKIDTFDAEFTFPKLYENNKNMHIICITQKNTYKDFDFFKKWNLYGMICRKYSHEKIAHIVKLISMGEKYFPSEVLQDDNIITLTESQQEVLNLAKKGYSNKQIAYEMGISESTVKTHTSHLMKKFNCPNRICTIKKARDLGFI